LALLVCVIAGILPGCGRSTPAPAEAPAEAASSDTGADTATSASKKETMRAEADPANAADDPAAPAPKPATLAEVRQAIDWFKFPKPEGAVWEETDLLTTRYWVPGTVAQAASFYRKTMAAQGWSENKLASPNPEPDKYQSLEFTKAGFLVNLSLNGKKTSVNVNLRNCGNVDARRLPKPADAKVAAAHSSYLSYATSAKPESAAELCRKEFAALGWRETPVLGAKNYAKQGVTALRFVQNAMECPVTITPNKEGRTEVVYAPEVRRNGFEPADVAASFAARDIPKPATAKEALQALDLRTLPRLGELDFQINNGLRAKYEARASVAKAAAFYRKTLAELGWVLVPPLIDLDERGVLQLEKAGFFLSLHIEDLIEQVNKAGLVSIELTHHGNVDLRQLPYLPGAEIRHAREVHTQYRASASAEAAAAFYRKELAKLGWQEKGKSPDRAGSKTYRLEFFQNDSRLRVYIDTTRDDQTPIQLHTELGGER
jgi:hypothetical protein